jgi:hypothetical protein
VSGPLRYPLTSLLAALRMKYFWKKTTSMMSRVLPDSASVLSLLSDFYRGHATPSSDFEAWLREKGIPYQTFTY